MAKKVVEHIARAALDNLWLPERIDIIKFSDFFIKKSPNCIRNKKSFNEDGTEIEVPDTPDEDEYEQGFPESDYYLEINIGKIIQFDFDEANNKLKWALNRLRLFKPGLLWGELQGLFDPKDTSHQYSEVKRFHGQGPYPVYSAGYNGIFAMKSMKCNRLLIL
jgi:hypothetical protein